MYDKVLVTNDDDVAIGSLFFRRRRGLEWQEFNYTDEWQNLGRKIDPELPLMSGLQRASRSEFACFSDAAPDSWGRALLRRYFKQILNKNSLLESTYLLSVNDSCRIGDFRFFDQNQQLISLADLIMVNLRLCRRTHKV
ncbi:MAG: HipA N-terminal domain-containing protein [Desulfovibrionaceae bacterium]|nr:HipA N-terminal domain-containing protein [Desulfovibrionaceae bacterium]